MLSSASRALVLASRANPGVLSRNFTHVSVVSSPPRTRISLVEKVAHGLIMTGAMLAVPCWILLNMKVYRGERAN